MLAWLMNLGFAGGSVGLQGPFRVVKREMFQDGAGTGEVGGTGQVAGEQFQDGQTAGEVGMAR